jgi:hypothetical protein
VSEGLRSGVEGDISTEPGGSPYSIGVAIGVAELRNRYGTGHGAAGQRVGLSNRHAHLAVNAAFTWCQLMLDTLADEHAPWRQNFP